MAIAIDQTSVSEPKISEYLSIPQKNFRKLMAFSATNQGFLHVLECFLAIGLNLDLLGKEGKRSY